MYESELLKLKEKVFAQLHKMPDGNDYQQITPMVNEWLVQAYNLGKSARYRAAKAKDQAMSDLGLTKVKGAVSGKTYYE